MSQRSPRRPAIAALLSALQPGLGHLYLREWLRAIAWSGLWVVTVGVLVRTAGAALEPGDLLAVLVGYAAALDGLPAGATLAPVAVAAFATIDAFWLAARNNRRLDAVRDACPHCGRELDRSLEFCHWCTTRLDDEVTEPDP